MMQLDSLSVGYTASANAVLCALDLHVPAGGFVCLLGRNGAGKSTLLRTLAGLQSPLAGQVVVEGQAMQTMSSAERARRVAVVLTERQFGLGLTVEEVVAMGRQPHTGWRGRLNTDDWRLVNDAIAEAGAAALVGRYLDDLSDGEKQRVMIARAIAQAPQIMLLDEITAFLDLPGRVESMLLLKRYAVQRGATVVLSSHDLELSLQLADTIWLLNGKGECLAGSPQDLQASGVLGSVFDTDTVAYSSESKQFLLLGK